MSDNNLYDNAPATGGEQARSLDEAVVYVAPGPVAESSLAPQPAPRRSRRGVLIPLVLFLATCASTYTIGGPVYALCLMTILVCHEAGHFLQAQRYGVYSSLPFFIPVPIPPIGTLGAVIGMSSNITNRRALFDIGISGPLAGLVPTVIFCVLGLMWSEPVPWRPGQGQTVGTPILMGFIAEMVQRPIPDGWLLSLHPMALAGWVGMLITALNLFPIGQLDGGHVLYALMRRKAHVIATAILLGAVILVVLYQYYWWTLMLVLLMLMGPQHPPTGDDAVALGPWRTLLGWLTLAFLPLGFTPNPFGL